MNSGELITATQNSICMHTLMILFQKTIDWYNIDLKPYTKYSPHEVKGDDSFKTMIAPYTEEVKDGIRYITYSEKVIKDIEKLSEVMDEVFNTMGFKLNSKGGINNQTANYLKKFFFFGYLFPNRRSSYTSSENFQEIDINQQITALLGLFRLDLERGGNSDKLHKILINFVRIKNAVKGNTKYFDDNYKKNTQRFVIKLYASMFFGESSGGYGIPLVPSLLSVPNSEILTQYILIRSGDVYEFDSSYLVRIYKKWYESNRGRNQYLIELLRDLKEGKYIAKGKNNFGFEIKLDKKAFDDTLDSVLLQRSSIAQNTLRKLGNPCPRSVAYTETFFNYLSDGFKSTGNYLSAIRKMKWYEYKNLYEMMGKRKEEARLTFIDGILKIMRIEVGNIETNNVTLPNIAISSSDEFYDLINLLGYSTNSNIRPLDLNNLQSILDSDRRGPKNIKAQQLLPIFLDPFYLYSTYNMEILLEAVGFDSKLANSIQTELALNAMLYYFVIVKGYSFISETIILADLSEQNLKRFITIDCEYVTRISSVLYSMGLFVLILGLKKKEFNRVKIIIDNDKMFSLLKRFGYIRG